MIERDLDQPEIMTPWALRPGTTVDWPAGDPSLDRCPVPSVVRKGRLAVGLRRSVDFALALIVLIVCAVPMVLIAAVVVATSPGGALYRQTRVGRRGRPIEVLKFRSMCADADQQLRSDPELRARYLANDYKLQSEDDPRITGFGRVLRKTSLDELPQLWNVLRGDMSFVGIRPLLRQELEERPADDQELYKLLRPGITGLWQVRGRSTVGKVDRLAFDREYVETWSPWNDFKILASTPLAVLRVHHTH